MLKNWLLRYAATHKPDFIIGGADNPYLIRWYLTPWRKWLSKYDRAKGWRKWLLWPTTLFPQVYLHHFLRDDDDRALHDHPWLWASYILQGEYTEHQIKAGGVHTRTLRKAGSFVMRLPTTAHRVELQGRECWTLFFTGPRMRNWGFHCQDKGWIPWQKFTKTSKPGEIGPGCD